VKALVAAGVVLVAALPSFAGGSEAALRTVRPFVSVLPARQQTSPTRRSTIWFTTRFSRPVFGFTATDVDVGGSARGLRVVSLVDFGDHRRFNVAVRGMRASGTVMLNVGPRKARDALGRWNVRARAPAVVQYQAPDTGAAGALGIVADAAGWGVRTMDVVAQLRSVRWDREEVKPGLRAVLARARQLGIRMLVLTHPDQLVRNVAAYPDVTWWEVDNEPYIHNVDPSGWAIAVRDAIVAARKINPWARFIVPMTTLYRWNGEWRPWDDWLWEAVPNFGAYVDGWSVHPYCDSNPPEAWSASDPMEQRWQFRRFEVVHDRLAARGVHTPGWITEFGYPTGGHESVDEATQADYLRRAVSIVRSKPYIQAMFLYHLRDWGPADEDREHYFGTVLTRHGSFKKAAKVLRSL
jgi:hypothetical protein